MGTAMFASVVLLSLIMAIVVVTLTLAAAVCGRAIAAWIVLRVSGIEPLIHVIASNDREASHAITEILCLRSNDGSHFQVELGGQVFISGRRVASRSRWQAAMLAIFGVLVDPYDIANCPQAMKEASTNSTLWNALSRQTTRVPSNEAWGSPLPTAAEPIMRSAGMEYDKRRPMMQSTARRVSTNNISCPSHQSSPQTSRVPNDGVPGFPFPTAAESLLLTAEMAYGGQRPPMQSTDRRPSSDNTPYTSQQVPQARTEHDIQNPTLQSTDRDLPTDNIAHPGYQVPRAGVEYGTQRPIVQRTVRCPSTDNIAYPSPQVPRRPVPSTSQEQ